MAAPTGAGGCAQIVQIWPWPCGRWRRVVKGLGQFGPSPVSDLILKLPEAQDPGWGRRLLIMTCGGSRGHTEIVTIVMKAALLAARAQNDISLGRTPSLSGALMPFPTPLHAV